MKVLILFLTLVVLLGALFVYTKSPKLRVNKTMTKESSQTVQDLPQKVMKGGWIAWWDEQNAISSLENSKGLIDSISPVWYRIDDKGKLRLNNTRHMGEILALVKEQNINIYIAISNESETGFNGENVSSLINDRKKTNQFIQDIQGLLAETGANGIDLDFENLKEEDRDSYSQFISVVAEKLHKNNKALSVTVHAQKGVNDWVGTKGHDLKALGKYADFIRIMIYDFHHSNSPAGSVTPLSEFIQTVDYTLSQVPSQKVVVALPTYGYEWGEKFRSLNFGDIEKLITDMQISPTLDRKTYSMNFDYTKNSIKHEVWYETPATLSKKMNYAYSKGIRQYYFWKIGGENKDIWAIDPK